MVPDLDPASPAFMRAVLQALLDHGDVTPPDASGRQFLCVAVEPWMLDALAMFGADQEDHEDGDAAEDDDPCGRHVHRHRHIGPAELVNLVAWRAAYRRRRHLRGGRRAGAPGGLHAPERDEAGGAEATAFMRRLTAGQTVACEISGGDRYGRAVAICYLPDGRDVAAELVRAGLGRDCARYSRGRYAALDRRPDMRLPGYCER